MTAFETKILKKKKVDKSLLLKVTQSGLNGRIFVEFSSDDGKLIVQKSFQSTFDGMKEAEEFQKKFRSTKDFKKYLGIEEKKK